MKFTSKNLLQEVPKLKLEPDLKKRWENVMKPNIDLYEKSDTIKRGIDLFVMQLNQRYGDKTPAPAPAPVIPPEKRKVQHKRTVYELQGQMDIFVEKYWKNKYSKEDLERISYKLSEKKDKISAYDTDSWGLIVMERQAIDFVLEKKYDKPKPAPAPAPAKQKPAASQKIVAKPKASKQPKSKKERPVYTGDFVEKISPEVIFIKRFCWFNNKQLNFETKEKALRLLNSLQKAIVEKQIRKTSKYAGEINSLQDNLLKLVSNRADGSDITVAEKYFEIAKSQKISSTVAFLKQFLAIQGKEGVKEKAKTLSEKIRTYFDNGGFSHKDNGAELTAIRKSLQDYADGKTPTPEISAQVLNGLYGLAGIDTLEPKPGIAINAAQFVGSQFDTLNFTGKWRNLIYWWFQLGFGYFQLVIGCE
jgi:hypothetical protein